MGQTCRMRFRGGWLGRFALLAFVTLVPALVASNCPAKDAKSDAASVALPERPAEIAPFMAKIDDQQARATLARVLEDRVRAQEPEGGREMLMDLEHATKTLGDRLGQIVGSAGEAAAAPGVYWRWLTQNGSDPTAPLRAMAGAAILIAVAWLAQAAAGAATLKALDHLKTGPLVRTRLAAAVMPLRWLVFIGAAAAAHSLVPEVTRASRLTALAIILTFTATWIASRVISVWLPALVAGERSSASWGLRPRVLDMALGIFFAGLFGLAVLRQAGISADARLIGATLVWIVFGGLFLLAFGRMRQTVPNAPADSDAGSRPSFLDRYGMPLLRLSFVVILVATPLVALVRGPSAFWSGIASFGLLALFVASLGLTRAERPGIGEQPSSASPWVSTWRRGLQILAGVALTLALAFAWGIDLFHRANTHLGERVVQALMTVAIAVVLTYLVWEVIRTALAQSALGPPTVEIERGEEGGGTAATRLQTFGPVLRNFLLATLLTVATMVCLSAIGVDIGPLLAGAGVIGIALGFGAQTLVRDIISGVFYLAEDAFRIGEYISIGETRGTVEGIAIRSLKLRHHRGPIHTVPFGEIKQLTNYSRDWIIMKLEFLLAFDTDLTKVKKIVKGIGKDLEAHPELGHAILEPIKSQGVRRMEPTGMVVGLKFMATPGSEVYMLRREVYQRVRDAFEENGIQFARPQVMIAAPGDAPLSASARDQLAVAAIGIGAAHGPTGPRLVPQP
jgi:small-conductance mechanosensitive channel